MGAISSRQNAGVEEVDITVNHAYRYPPKSGNYFSNHFIMGGERFDTAQPEMYLFGDNSDLNFLGARPAPFPYPAPSSSEPSRTLKALVNIRKESLRFVRVPDDSLSLKEPENRSTSTHFNVEFTFDCDVRCAITIMYFCTEEISPSGLIYTPKDSSMNSETYHYKRGANQQFSQVCHLFDPSKYSEEDLGYSFDKEVMPIVILCEAEEGEDIHQIHSTIAIVEKHSDGYALKPLKQKLFVDGLCYLLQEIYGIENKNVDNSKGGAEDDTEDNGAECVICMCDLRDTLILPCRHLCLCNCCADSLRYQANNCPICRAPFRALLQLKALQKSNTPGAAVTANESTEGIPAGYQSVPLIEALNGPSVTPQQPVAPPYQDIGYQDNLEPRGAFNNGLEDSTTQTELTCSTDKAGSTQMRMSVLIAQESSEDSTFKKLDESGVSSPTKSYHHKKKRARYHKEDSISSVNETSLRTKEFSDADSRKLKKSMSSPISPSDSTSLTRTNIDLDDTEDNPETLGLLDPLESCHITDGTVVPRMVSTSSSDLKISSPVKIKSDNLSIGSGSFCPNEQDVEEILDNEFAGACGGIEAELDLEDPSSRLPYSASFEHEGLSKEFNDDSIKPDRGSKKGRQKHRRSSSHRSRGSSIGSPYSNSETGFADDSHQNLASESHSLPGTPLSTSSAVSRTSDVSVSSVSSTKALIVSHPPPPNSSSGTV